MYESDDFDCLFGNIIVALPLVGAQAIGAVLDAVFGVGKIAAAVFAQSVEGAVAEDAAKGFGIGVLVAGEVFAFFVLEKVIVGHCVTSFELVPGVLIGWGSGEGQLFAGLGLAEAQFCRPEGDAAILRIGAVLLVSQQGQSAG